MQNQLVAVEAVSLYNNGVEMNNIEYKFENLKLRSCKKTINKESYETLEIVETDNETLAYWEKENNNFDIKFVGSRHLEYQNKSFWKIYEFGNDIIQRRKS